MAALPARVVCVQDDLPRHCTQPAGPAQSMQLLPHPSYRYVCSGARGHAPRVHTNTAAAVAGRRRAVLLLMFCLSFKMPPFRNPHGFGMSCAEAGAGTQQPFFLFFAVFLLFLI